MAQVQAKAASAEKAEKTVKAEKSSSKKNGAGKKHKPPIEQAFARVQRLGKDFEKIVGRISTWSQMEKPEERAPLDGVVSSLRSGNWEKALIGISSLVSNGYEPPKGVKPAKRKLEVVEGVQVWLRANARKHYEQAYPNGELDNLYVEKVANGTVRVKVGPKGHFAGAFLIGQVRASAPASEE